MAKYEIWNNGIECGKAVANTGSNIKEIWNQGVLWWKKQYGWMYIGSTSIYQNSFYNHIQGTNSILFYSFPSPYSHLYVYLVSLSGYTCTFQTVDTVAFEKSENSIIGFYANEYYYMSTIQDIVLNHKALKISEIDGTSELVTNYDTYFYVNGSLFTGTLYTANSQKHFYYFDSFGVLYICAYQQTTPSSNYSRILVPFITTDFIHFYADNIAYHNSFNVYYPTVVIYAINGVRTTDNGVQPYYSYSTSFGFSAFDVIGNDIFLYKLSTPNTVGQSIYYRNIEMCCTDDFVLFNTIYTQSELDNIRGGHSYPSALSFTSFFKFPNISGVTGLYFLDNVHRSLQARDFDYSDVGAAVDGMPESCNGVVANMVYRLFYGYSDNNKLIIATASIENELIDYEETEITVNRNNNAHLFFTFGDFVYCINDPINNITVLVKEF